MTPHFTRRYIPPDYIDLFKCNSSAGSSACDTVIRRLLPSTYDLTRLYSSQRFALAWKQLEEWTEEMHCNEQRHTFRVRNLLMKLKWRKVDASTPGRDKRVEIREWENSLETADTIIAAIFQRRIINDRILRVCRMKNKQVKRETNFLQTIIMGKITFEKLSSL